MSEGSLLCGRVVLQLPEWLQLLLVLKQLLVVSSTSGMVVEGAGWDVLCCSSVWWQGVVLLWLLKPRCCLVMRVSCRTGCCCVAGAIDFCCALHSSDWKQLQ